MIQSCSLVFLVLCSGQITTEVFLHLRYEGTDCALMVTAAGYPSNAQSCLAGDFRGAFTKRLALCLLICSMIRSSIPALVSG